MRKTKVTLWSSEKIEEINYGNDHLPAIGLLSISSGVSAKGVFMYEPRGDKPFLNFQLASRHHDKLLRASILICAPPES